jgi:hypothetical protein
MEGTLFDDGEFAGTNTTKLFEQIVAKANAYAKIAEMASKKGKSASGVKASRHGRPGGVYSVRPTRQINPRHS